VYAFKLSWATRRRYWLAKLAPTFNRGYDVEGHIVESMQRAPFAVTDPAAATAFLIPVRPYLERVAAYPKYGRDAIPDNVRDVVERIKREEPGAWALSEPGCRRVLVSAHDTGTYAANRTDPVVGERAVFIASNSDVTTADDLLALPNNPEEAAAEASVAHDDSSPERDDLSPEKTAAEERNTESVFRNDKDVSAVCSLSFHLPRDAVAMGAVTPLGITAAGTGTTRTGIDAAGTGTGTGTGVDATGTGTAGSGPEDGGGERTAVEDHPRPITVSFRGNTRGTLRGKIFCHLKGLKRPDWSLESSGQVTPRQYMELMASSKYCLHVRGTRVQSPRLVEVLTFGCVPVIIADGYELPLGWLLDWTKFSIRLPEAEYERLPEVLDAADWGSLHDNLRRVVGFFVYHRAPVFGDAFWATMLGTQRQMARGAACRGIIARATGDGGDGVAGDAVAGDGGSVGSVVGGSVGDVVGESGGLGESGGGSLVKGDDAVDEVLADMSREAALAAAAERAAGGAAGGGGGGGSRKMLAAAAERGAAAAAGGGGSRKMLAEKSARENRTERRFWLRKKCPTGERCWRQRVQNKDGEEARLLGPRY
jgi:hypothetical protein